MAELRRAGRSYRQISAELGLALTTVYGHCCQARATRSYEVVEPRDGGDDDETPREARARIQRDVVDGKRCRVCWLLLPCDHRQ